MSFCNSIISMSIMLDRCYRSLFDNMCCGFWSWHLKHFAPYMQSKKKHKWWRPRASQGPPGGPRRSPRAQEALTGSYINRLWHATCSLFGDSVPGELAGRAGMTSSIRWHAFCSLLGFNAIGYELGLLLRRASFVLGTARCMHFFKFVWLLCLV